jgi:glutathione S-transferase
MMLSVKGMSADPILYSFRRCPYAMRARLALIVSDRVCELREVVLRDKPQEMLAASAKGTVPVLVDPDGQVLDESLDIMLWALNQHDPQGWLTPERGDLQTMLDLIAQFDQEFKYHLDRYKYAERYPGTDPHIHQAEGAGYLARLNAQLSETQHLFGDRISLADMAIAPFVRQFAHTDQTWFSQQPWLALQAWLERLLASEIYTQAMQKYPKWESGQPGVRFPAQQETGSVCESSL